MHENFEKMSTVRITHQEVPPIKEGETQLQVTFCFQQALVLPGFPDAPPKYLQDFIEARAAKCFADAYALQDTLNGTLVRVKTIEVYMYDPLTDQSAHSVIEASKIQYL